jgi:S1 RNA binding domain protein
MDKTWRDPVYPSQKPVNYEIVEGKVKKITKFGAFLSLDDGREAFLHISEIDTSFVKDVKDYLHDGDRIKAVVIGSNKRGELEVSIKRLRSLEEFEFKLSHFLKESDEKLGELKKSLEEKWRGKQKKW